MPNASSTSLIIRCARCASGPLNMARTLAPIFGGSAPTSLLSTAECLALSLRMNYGTRPKPDAAEASRSRRAFTDPHPVGTEHYSEVAEIEGTSPDLYQDLTIRG